MRGMWPGQAVMVAQNPDDGNAVRASQTGEFSQGAGNGAGRGIGGDDLTDAFSLGNVQKTQKIGPGADRRVRRVEPGKGVRDGTGDKAVDGGGDGKRRAAGDIGQDGDRPGAKALAGQEFR